MSPTLPAAIVSPGTERLHSKRAIVEDFFAIGVSRYVAFGLSFVAGLIQRRFLGPELVGAWQLLGLARQYLSYGDLGVIRGIEQRLPAMVAAGDPDESAYGDAAWTSVLATMTVLNVALIAATFALPWSVDPLILWGFRAMAVIAIIEAATIVMENVTLRARARFKALSVQVFVSETIFAALSIPAIWVAGVWGLLASVLVSLVFKLVYMRYVAPERLHWRFDWRKAAALAMVGFPLTVFVVLFKTFDALDRLLLARSGDLSALGYYSVASMTAVFLGHLPLVISTVYLPRTLSWVELSARADVIRYFKQSQLCILVLAAVVSAIGYFAMPFVVLLLLPTFTTGIAALKVTVMAAVFTAAVQMPQQYLAATRRYWQMAIVMAALLGVYYAASLFWSPRLTTAAEWLAFVSWGRLIAYAVLSVIMLAGVSHALSASLTLWGLGLAAIVAYVGGLVWTIDRAVPLDISSWRQGAVGLAVQLAAVAIGVLPLLLLVERQTRIVAALVASRRKPRQ
jgi:O-antigen/teichoic acid export membrane protein